MSLHAKGEEISGSGTKEGVEKKGGGKKKKNNTKKKERKTRCGTGREEMDVWDFLRSVVRCETLEFVYRRRHSPPRVIKGRASEKWGENKD